MKWTHVAAAVTALLAIGGAAVGYVEVRHGEALEATEKVEQRLVPRDEIQLLREKLESDHEAIMQAIEELKEKLK